MSDKMEKKDLKIVFFGTPEFAVASLDRIVGNGWQVGAVVTMPDKTAGRGHKLIESDVKRYAVSKGLKVLQPAKLKAPDFIEALKEINADLFVVIAFRCFRARCGRCRAWARSTSTAPCCLNTVAPPPSTVP